MRNLFQSKEAEQDIHLISLLTLSANVTRRPDSTVKEELRRLEVSLSHCLSVMFGVTFTEKTTPEYFYLQFFH